MKKTGGDVDEFLAAVPSPKRRRDAATIVSLMQDVAEREPEMWGTIVGFGSCHYRYPTGTEGDAPILAFSPRRQATTVYLLDAGAQAERLEALGPHESSVGCLYLKDVEAIDLGVLREILVEEVRRVTAGDTGSAVFTVTG
ncbi:DUF1801 domain-containing protein [Microbacterium sp. ZW T2_14]|uniref:DUF1801 domain-containing protein n=1 Tax=Microbacterium sp. ZW T2_14 TaxID=3378079 RepID=UPI0038518F42